MKIVVRILFLFLLPCIVAIPHGFVGSTLVGLYHDQNDMHVSKIAARFFSGQKTDVCSFKEKAQKWKKKKVQAVAYCQSEVSLVLTFSNQSLDFSENIQFSPLQLFYRISDKTWMQAYQLQEGDLLLGPNGHGGPHWDVEHPDGNYDNVFPGGKIRGQK